MSIPRTTARIPSPSATASTPAQTCSSWSSPEPPSLEGRRCWRYAGGSRSSTSRRGERSTSTSPAAGTSWTTGIPGVRRPGTPSGWRPARGRPKLWGPMRSRCRRPITRPWPSWARDSAPWDGPRTGSWRRSSIRADRGGWGGSGTLSGRPTGTPHSRGCSTPWSSEPLRGAEPVHVPLGRGRAEVTLGPDGGLALRQVTAAEGAGQCIGAHRGDRDPTLAAEGAEDRRQVLLDQRDRQGQVLAGFPRSREQRTAHPQPPSRLVRPVDGEPSVGRLEDVGRVQVEGHHVLVPEVSAHGDVRLALRQVPAQRGGLRVRAAAAGDGGGRQEGQQRGHPHETEFPVAFRTTSVMPSTAANSPPPTSHQGKGRKRYASVPPIRRAMPGA